MLLIAGLEDRPDNYTAEWSRPSAGKMFSLCFLLQDFIYHFCKTTISNQGKIHDQCWLMCNGFRPLQGFTNLALTSNSAVTYRLAQLNFTGATRNVDLTEPRLNPKIY